MLNIYDLEIQMHARQEDLRRAAARDRLLRSAGLMGRGPVAHRTFRRLAALLLPVRQLRLVRLSATPAAARACCPTRC